MSEVFKIYDVVTTWRNDDPVVVSATVVRATDKQWRIERDVAPVQCSSGFGYRTVLSPDSYGRTPQEAIQRYINSQQRRVESLQKQSAHCAVQELKARALLAKIDGAA